MNTTQAQMIEEDAEERVDQKIAEARTKFNLNADADGLTSIKSPLIRSLLETEERLTSVTNEYHQHVEYVTEELQKQEIKKR
jgi:hypothetical protein